MAKYYGTIAFSITKETRPGVWMEEIIQKKYVGDIIRNSRHMSESQDTTNREVRLSNQISIVAKDGFIIEHFQNIIFVEWLGAKWAVSSIDINYPRLTLTLGGPYAGQEITTS